MTDTKIFTISNINKIVSSLHKSRKSIVLVGGCFDLLHIGHIKFLEEAKKHGDVLVVLLESDDKVRRLKGKNRPLFTATERAKVLSSINFVDYLVVLPFTNSDADYENIITQIRPSVIALTQHDLHLAKKRGHATRVGAKLVVVPHFKTHSTSKLANMLGIN